MLIVCLLKYTQMSEFSLNCQGMEKFNSSFNFSYHSVI
jgi:hypothetical protein